MQLVMTDHLKADPEGWTSEGTPNCWYRRKLTPADIKLSRLKQENIRLLEAISSMESRLRHLEKENSK